jgi:tetratricopeptide (TPR) repeat protein
LKYFLDPSSRRARILVVAASLVAISAFAELPSWMRNTEAGSAIEAAFFRMMSLSGGTVSFRRPPSETRPALGDLIKAQPRNGELYSLRALEDEQQLDFVAAESDWKAYLANSSDKTGAQLALADFYHRRLRPLEEIKAVSLVANAPDTTAEKLTPPAQQRSWQAFERIFGVIQAQGQGKDVSIAQYRAWIARYPQEQSLYSRFLQFLVTEKEYGAAEQLIVDYRKQFRDEIFPVKAKAMVEYRRGSVREGLSVYEQSFQPLWNPELVKSYFDLLRETQNLRKFRDDAHAALLANPEDLNATARMFYYYQQQGKSEVARQTIADFSLHKEARKSEWSSQELFTCARLLEDIHAYPESARYYFALYNSKGMPEAQEVAISGLTSILLTAPEMPIRIGSGDLSMYRDIATMDQGPGYLNGILSLILNTSRPATQYSEEEQRAVPYFHRSRAAELLALLDARFPNSSRRSALHSQLLEFYSTSGESDAVIEGGREYLANFPNAPERTAVALLMASAYSRNGDTGNEFAIYDSVLKELAAKAQSVPLGLAGTGDSIQDTARSAANSNDVSADAEGDGGSEAGEEQESQRANARHRASDSFRVGTNSALVRPTGARSPEYARVLERYLARLAETKQVLPALAVLRREIDRNPDDPGLYERLAVFVDQNRLGSEQEEVYKRAIAKFPDKSWSDKLARFYLRHKRDSEFEQLTRDAVRTFSGSELERYFNNVDGGSPGLYLRLNLYAHERFPHNPVFVRNLLSAYQNPPTRDLAAWEALLRQHWFEEPEMRNQFFEFLSRRGILASELGATRQSAPDAAAWEKNPAAASFLAYGDLWRSHFESSAPVLKVLAAQYPAETEIGHAASSVYRSLAYFEPSDTEIAAKIEDKLLQANPGDTETMARIGDIYADRSLFTQAAPYWERIPQVAPGQPSGFLDAATIYWDYFDFDNALRQLAGGRKRLGNASLYGYEAGAIYENKRDYPHAIEEYVKGALNGQGSSAEGRLLELARRPKFRDLVDQSTAKVAVLPNPSTDSVNLRVRVLEVQNRKQEMATFLDAIVSSTTSIEQAEDVETLAQQKSLEGVRQHALEKQATLTTDPVTRLQLRYSLIRLYESRKDFDAARKNVEALYRENPKILGVVRSTVDFYWRMKMPTQAIDVLRQAAKDANPELGRQFSYEAARKLTEAKRFPDARELLATLLKDSPYNGEYLAAMADTYAQAGDDRELQQFYLDKIAAFRADATLSADARKAQIATLRRGLIPSLTRMKNYPGAVDQYIELINNYPEDESLVTEAALYALRYQRQPQLADFYVKTVAKSPRDYRWSMVLARIQTNLEDYPAAIDTFAKAITIRPDRIDLLTARAGLEERLMRFDEAAADYERIYQLSYKSPQWMEKVATLRARQGKTDDAVAALETALITGRPENAANYFEVARRLESWGMLAPARGFAEKGVSAAGADLLIVGDYQTGVKTYARIMTRLRQYSQADETLQKAFAAASSNMAVLKQHVQKQGVSAVTDSEWRENTRRMRSESARSAMAAALEEMAATENTYFTPEERLAFSHFADAKRASMNPDDVEKFAIPMAESGALAYQEALWRYEMLMQRRWLNDDSGNLRRFIELQRQRGLFSELGANLERYANVVPPVHRVVPLLAAADAYRSSGDAVSELRVLQSVSLNDLDNAHQQRLFNLLLTKQPQELVRIASTWNAGWGEQAASYIVANGGSALSHSMVLSRGKVRPAVWNKAYNALVGLYYTEPTRDVSGAFVAALGDDPIGARIGKPVDRDRQLAGQIWFYYGSRYGEYLGTTKQGSPEDFLPAVLEESPASASGYLTLADYYADAGDLKRAVTDYNHTLELSPNRPAVIDRLAVAYYRQRDRAAALAQWKRALSVLANQINSPRVPETFWADFGRTCDQLAARKLFVEVKPEVETIVRSYLRHNGTYRSNAVLHPAYTASADPAAASVWLVSLASSASNPDEVLSDIADASWIPLANRGVIYQHILESKRDAAGKLTGVARDNAEQDYGSWQARWIEYLVRSHQFVAAAAAIEALPKQIRNAEAASVVPLELQAAARLGTLDSKISEYRNEPARAPANEILKNGARKLFEGGDKQSARKVLEYVFGREIEEHQLSAANFLGLAEIRLAAGDTPGTLDLLHRLVVAVGNPLENLDPVAALLEKTGHNAEAIEFLEQLVRSAPWDPSYRLRLAKAKLAAGNNTGTRELLVVIAAGAQNPYELRVQSAMALAGGPHADLGSGELELLSGTSGAATVASADKFYFYEARMKAARSAADSHARIQILTHCIIDFPRREEARVPLFRAAASAQSDEFALAAIGPLLQRQFLREDTSSDKLEEIISSGEESDDTDEAGAESAISTKQLTRAQKAEVARLVADVLIRLDRVNEAVSYYDTSRRLEPLSVVRKTLVRKIDEARIVLRRQRDNRLRQPIFHEALEQDRVVRPRLVARVAPTPAPATTAKGAVKQ